MKRFHSILALFVALLLFVPPTAAQPPGAVKSHIYRLHGNSANIDTGGFQSFVGGGVTLGYPDNAGETLAVSSTSANDASAGTGARTVVVGGYTASWVWTEETVTLNGQTKVATTTSFIRVNKLTVATAGSGNVNAGLIYIAASDDTFTAGVPTDPFRTVGTGLSDCACGTLTTPANSNWVLYSMNASSFSGASKLVTMRAEIRLWGSNVWVTVHQMNMLNGEVNVEGYMKIPAKTDFRIRASSDTNDATLSVLAMFQTSQSSADYNRNGQR